MRGSLSPETRLAVALEGLNCSQRAFAALFDLQYSRFATIMADTDGVSNFSLEEAEQMAERVQEMAALQEAVNRVHRLPTPLNWNDPRIGIVLVIRRAAAISRESGSHSLDGAEQQVVGRIAQQ